MVLSFVDRKRIRKSFARIRSIVSMPNLIDVQRNSYKEFLGDFLDSSAEGKISGLQKALQSVFPIRDAANTCELGLVSYTFEPPKNDLKEYQSRGQTYSCALRVVLRLVVWDVDEDTGARSVRDIREQSVYLGEIPYMTEHGTFMINGTERVVVSQMHRSSGVFFDYDKTRSNNLGEIFYNARIIPYRGSWVDFEFDTKGILCVRIDRRRKLPVTTLLYALMDDAIVRKKHEAVVRGEKIHAKNIVGMTSQEILSYYYDVVEIQYDLQWRIPFRGEIYQGLKLIYDLIDAETGEIVVPAGQKMTVRTLGKLETQGLKYLKITEQMALDFAFFDSFSIQDDLEVRVGQAVELSLLEILAKNGHKNLKLFSLLRVDPALQVTLFSDKNCNREEALFDIYRVMRPGEPPTLETADDFFYSLFFDSERYDLSDVGRIKMNARLDISNEEVPDTYGILRRDDILKIVKILLELRQGRGELDDVDHLGNRRVRSVGELVENQYRIGLVRMERAIRERMGGVDLEKVSPQDLVNARPIVGVIREFFGSSQLSQFMDQTNPLSEITHKRRLSALGPGALTRERAGFEVRDVHTTHYGRICPIETPEGPNIGLINSLAAYACVNKYGFIESPYRRVVAGKVTNEVVYLSAIEEGKYIIAQADIAMTENGSFKDEFISCRKNGDPIMMPPDRIDFMDVSPQQIVSVAAALIPFLENDDANRALMGSNMQRQAVPLLSPEAPFVGTGVERVIARDSGSVIVAKRSGIVQQVDATRIVVRATEDIQSNVSGVDIYCLSKFQRSNHSTCINQKPLVKVGDGVSKGDIIADGQSMDKGELALGKNVLVAFMPWNGYNFEDSILISERIVRDDVFTSIHVEEFEAVARDTKLGLEEITRDLPNVGEDAMSNLDESGIIAIGSEVKAGDILVGKVTPKGETPVTPEEKLLRAIFGEKAADVRDTSLRLPPGEAGVVVDVRIFNRRGIDKDERTLVVERQQIEQIVNDRDRERSILQRSFAERLVQLLLNQTFVSGLKGLSSGSLLTEDILKKFTSALLKEVVIENEEVMKDVGALVDTFEKSIANLNEIFEDKVEKIQSGNDMPPGVLKMIKVFVAVKRKLQSGDKMAGRHGNKGVVSRIVALEDMPYLADGTPVDIVLSPLGVPSRMNVGQILETHLGWACRGLGKQVEELLNEYRVHRKDISDIRDKLKDIYGESHYKEEMANYSDQEVIAFSETLFRGIPIETPVFDGAREEDISEMLEKAGLENAGQVILSDGRTGEPFDRKVTVGYIYMMKLHHLVDDKMHSRSVGPYSLVTQQPLGGKAQFGGQRFGEMEVWALEAYGAAYTLQEMLTIKSDDVSGRIKAYEAIIRGEDTFEVGIPESFNVLVKEMRALGLDVELSKRDVY